MFETKDTGSHDASISKEQCEAYATSKGLSFTSQTFGNAQAGPAYGCFLGTSVFFQETDYNHTCADGFAWGSSKCVVRTSNTWSTYSYGSAFGYSADAVATHATPDSSGLAEYDCSNPATTGTFKLTTSCTLSAEVVVSGTLTIIGQTEDMNNLITITAKSASRHFKLRIHRVTSFLWHIKLTGGDVSSFSHSTSAGYGGSICVENNGELNLYYSELSGNKGHYGGAIYTFGGMHKQAIFNLYNSIIKDNEATHAGGGIFMESSVVTVQDTIIDNNEAISSSITTRAGGMDIWSCDITIKNTMVSNNNAATGGGVYISGGTNVLRYLTFNGNTGTTDGDEIYTLLSPSITLVNVVGLTASGIYDTTATWKTCADSICTGQCSAVDATDETLGVTCTNSTAGGYAKGALSKNGGLSKIMVPQPIDVSTLSFESDLSAGALNKMDAVEATTEEMNYLQDRVVVSDALGATSLASDVNVMACSKSGLAALGALASTARTLSSAACNWTAPCDCTKI